MTLRAFFRTMLICSLCLSHLSYAGKKEPDDLKTPSSSTSSSGQQNPPASPRRTPAQEPPPTNREPAVPTRRTPHEAHSAPALPAHEGSSAPITPSSAPSSWSDGFSSFLSTTASGVAGFVSHLPQVASSAFTAASSVAGHLPVFRASPSVALKVPLVKTSRPEEGLVSMRKTTSITAQTYKLDSPHDLERRLMYYLKNCEIPVESLSVNQHLLAQIYSQIKWPDPDHSDIQSLVFIIMLLSKPTNPISEEPIDRFAPLFDLTSFEDALLSFEFIEFIVDILPKSKNVTSYSDIGRIIHSLWDIMRRQPEGAIDIPINSSGDDVDGTDIYLTIITKNRALLRALRRDLICKNQKLYALFKTAWLLVEYIRIIRREAHHLGLPFLLTPHRCKVMSEFLIQMISGHNHLEFTLNILLGRAQSMRKENALLEGPTFNAKPNDRTTSMPQELPAPTETMEEDVWEFDFSGITRELMGENDAEVPPPNDGAECPTLSAETTPEAHEDPVPPPTTLPVGQESHAAPITPSLLMPTPIEATALISAMAIPPQDSLRRVASAENAFHSRPMHGLGLRRNPFSFQGALGMQSLIYPPPPQGRSSSPDNPAQPSAQFSLGTSIDDTPEAAAPPMRTANRDKKSGPHSMEPTNF